MSRVAGRLAALALPPPLQRSANRLFARATGIDLEELSRPIGEYRSLQELFTRPLPQGVRPVDPTPDSLIAPCDGYWGAAGRIDDGRLLQVKGRTYTTTSLLGDSRSAAAFAGGEYATFYLAPHNYHRFHAPCDLQIDTAEHIAGTLWPVNRAGLEGVENLFARNERLSVYASPVVPGGNERRICMVAVGAVMVGKVRVVFDDLTTNIGGAPGVRRRRCYDPPIAVKKGEEWGRFEFGSTIVLLAAPGTLHIDVQPSGTPLRLGTRIGRVIAPTRSE